MNLLKEISSSFENILSKDLVEFLLTTSLPDLVEEIIFNPLYYHGFDYKKASGGKTDMDMLPDTKLYARMMAGCKTKEDKFFVQSKDFMLYRWVSSKNFDLVPSDYACNIPIKFIVFNRVYTSLLENSSRSESYNVFPEEILVSKDSLAGEYDFSLAMEILSDKNTGLAVHMKNLNGFIDLCIKTLYSCTDIDKVQRCLNIMLSDKSPGVSVMDIYEESVRLRGNVFLNTLFSKSGESIPVSSLSKALLNGDLSQREFEIINYLLGIKLANYIREML